MDGFRRMLLFGHKRTADHIPVSALHCFDARQALQPRRIRFVLPEPCLPRNVTDGITNPVRLRILC